MLATSKFRLSCITLGLLFGGALKGDQVLLDVSSDTSIPWGAVRGDVFKVGFAGSQQDDVTFSTSDNSYSGQPYTVTRSGSYYTGMGLTTIYTLLGLDQNPIVGAYLALTLSSDGTLNYSLSLNPSATWNFMQNGFSMSTPQTWTNVANTLFPPPPPAPVIAPPVTFTAPPVVTFVPPPVVTTPNIGFVTTPFADLAENPEPATGVLLVSGVALVWLWRRKRATKV